jgi:hypothetical protein
MKRFVIMKDNRYVCVIQLFKDNSWRVSRIDGKCIDGADAMWLMPEHYKAMLRTEGVNV